MTTSGDVRWIKLTLAYDGGAYNGWQFQPNKPTVQGALEQALARIVGEPVRTQGAGRTDAGVHAHGQVVSFSVAGDLPLKAFQQGVNTYLPPDIRVLAAEEAAPGFNATADAVGKRYRYRMEDGRIYDLFARRYQWHAWHSLDVEAMQSAARLLLGTHDFSSFENAGSPRLHAVRTLFEVDVRRVGAGQGSRIDVDVVGDGFLYSMVRNIVGSLFEIGRGAQSVDWLAAALAARDRTASGRTAPPHGLALVEVFYDEDSMMRSLNCRDQNGATGQGRGAPCESPT